MNLPTSGKKVNGSSRKSYRIILSNHHLFICFPQEILSLEARYCISPSLPPAWYCTRQRRAELKRHSQRRLTKPDLLKCLYKSKTAVSLFTYIHMYRKDLVFLAFRAEAPASPGQSPPPGNVSQIQQSSNHESVSATEASVLPLLRVPWFCQGNIANNHSHFTWF